MLSEDKIIRTRAQLREYLDVELWRYPIHGRRYLSYALQLSEGAILRRHTVLLRKTEYYTNTGRRVRALIYHTLLMHMQNKYALHIPLNSFGKGLRIYHIAPLVMNGDISVGENCTLHAMSSIVYGGGDGDDVPTLGDNVTVGLGATIIGGVTIADNITIGAGAVVNKSFLEPGITIAGVPAKKISDESKKF